MRRPDKISTTIEVAEYLNTLVKVREKSTTVNPFYTDESYVSGIIVALVKRGKKLGTFVCYINFFIKFTQC